MMPSRQNGNHGRNSEWRRLEIWNGFEMSDRDEQTSGTL
jgi:hypothetical protein